MILLQILTTILAIAGGVFIIFKNRFGFVLWVVSNSGYILIFALSGLWISIIPFIFYQGTNIWGWIKWGKK